jgi:hypothetical protein
VESMGFLGKGKHSARGDGGDHRKPITFLADRPSTRPEASCKA